MTRIAVIGCGRWGPNYVRNFAELDNAEVVAVSDPNAEAVGRVKHRFPEVEPYADYRKLLQEAPCDAIVVVTPASTHREITEACLGAGKHVLVEKPLADNPGDALALARCARAPGQILMVGHIFRFNAAINKMRDLIYDGTIGQVRYIHCARTNLGPVRADVSVFGDLAPHDISIVLHLLNEMPVTVSATLATYVESGGDLGIMRMRFESGVVAVVYVSWLDPRKRREVEVIGSNAALEFDDMNLSEPLRISQKALRAEPSYSTFGEFQFVAHASNVIIPAIEMREPLRVQCEHFLQCIQTGRQPLTDVEDGLRTCLILAAAERSAQMDGSPVALAGLPESGQ